MSKYRNTPVVIDNHRFPSKREAKRYVYLKLLQMAGEIRGLELQPKFPVVINGIKCFDYIADFAYVEKGNRVIEDSKGVRTDVFKIKKRCVEAQYGIRIVEV